MQLEAVNVPQGHSSASARSSSQCGLIFFSHPDSSSRPQHSPSSACRVALQETATKPSPGPAQVKVLCQPRPATCGTNGRSAAQVPDWVRARRARRMKCASQISEGLHPTGRNERDSCRCSESACSFPLLCSLHALLRCLPEQDGKRADKRQRCRSCPIDH